MHFLDIHFDCSRKLVISFHFVFPCCRLSSWYVTLDLFVAHGDLGRQGLIMFRRDSSFFFQNEEIFVQLDELNELDRIAHA